MTAASVASTIATSKYCTRPMPAVSSARVVATAASPPASTAFTACAAASKARAPGPKDSSLAFCPELSWASRIASSWDFANSS